MVGLVLLEVVANLVGLVKLFDVVAGTAVGPTDTLSISRSSLLVRFSAGLGSGTGTTLVNRRGSKGVVMFDLIVVRSVTPSGVVPMSDDANVADATVTGIPADQGAVVVSSKDVVETVVNSLANVVCASFEEKVVVIPSAPIVVDMAPPESSAGGVAVKTVETLAALIEVTSTDAKVVIVGSVCLAPATVSVVIPTLAVDTRWRGVVLLTRVVVVPGTRDNVVVVIISPAAG